jgi:hypothetical protein
MLMVIGIMLERTLPADCSCRMFREGRCGPGGSRSA